MKIPAEKIMKLAGCILLCNLAGIISFLSTALSTRVWYRLLLRPVFAPSVWAYPSIWILFCTIMGISLWLVLEKGVKTRAAVTAVTIFLIQLTFNCLWLVVFFKLHLIFPALMLIGALVAFIIMNIILFYKISKLAAFILLPYLAWMIFVAIMNSVLFIYNG